MGVRRAVRMWLGLAAAAGVAGAWGAGASTALGQAVPGAAGTGAENLQQQEQRLRELQGLEFDTRLRANDAVPVGQRALVDYGAYLQLNYLTLDDSGGDTHGLREGDVYPYLRVNLDGAQEFFLRGRIGYQDFNTGDSFSGRGDEPIDGDVDRAYYRFDLRRYRAAHATDPAAVSSDFNLIFQGGRDFIYWANGLVLAQTLDGVLVDVVKGPFDLQLLAGVTPVRTVDFDTSRPDFDFRTHRGFFGGMVTATAGDHRPFVYGLVERDFNDRDFLQIGPIDTKFNYNSWYIGAGSNGALTDNLRYGIEAAYEGGSGLSNSFIVQTGGGLFPVKQTYGRIGAWAVDGRLEYLVNDPHQTRLGFEVIAAGGDHDRLSSTNTFGGNQAGTKDHAFNAFGLLNTGLALNPEVSNVLVLRFGGATLPLPDVRPFQRMQVGVDLFVINKLLKDAPIEQSTIAGQRFLGFEPDLYVNWQVTSDVTLALRYGVFFPNDRAFARDDARQFFYGGLTFSF